MPRVPEYDQFKVQSGNLPGVRQSSNASPAAFGQGAAMLAEAGRGLASLGTELGRQQIDAQNEANQVRVNDALNKAVEARLRRTYDPQEGYNVLKGNDALTRPDGKSLDDEYGEKYATDLSGIESTLGNDAQKQQFRQQSAQLTSQFRAGLQQHVAQQYQAYRESVNTGTVDVARQQMGEAWDNPEILTQSRDAIRAAVAELGQSRGLSGQAIEAATTVELSKANAAVIAAAADAGNLDYAREYLKQNNTDMTPEARLAAQKIVDTGDFERRTQEATDTLVAQHGGDTAGALRAARGKYSGKEEDAIVTRIKAIDAERQTLRERGQRDAADTAWRLVAQGKTPPPSLLAALDGRDTIAIRNALEPKEVKTNPNVYYALTLAAAQDPAAFQKEDLRRYFDKLAPGDRKQLIDLQARASKPEEADQIATVQSQVTHMAASLGLKEEERGTFQIEADKALSAAQTAKGKTLTQDERQKVLDRLVIEGTVPGDYWGSNQRRAYQASAEGRSFTPEFSDADRRRAIAALQRQGVAKPTAQQVESTMRAYYGFSK